jgi:hypothetical protein
VIVGSVLAVALAVVADLLFVFIGWWAAPWSRSPRPRRREIERPVEPIGPAEMLT